VGYICSSPIFTSELQIRSLDEASNTIRYCKNCGGLGRIVAKYMKRDTKATKTAIFSMRRKMNIKARTLVLPVTNLTLYLTHIAIYLKWYLDCLCLTITMP